MGLDITWYRKLTPAKHESDHTTNFYIADSFAARAKDIAEGTHYAYLESDSFRAGSYSGYNEWRDQLAKLAGYQSAEDVWHNRTEGPFYELIDFSDCEGVLGAATSAKLAKDFAQFQEQADAHADNYFRTKYREWRNAFEKAADRGAVSFH